MRSSVSIDVAAPAQLVFRIAHDVERWPRLLPHYVAVDVAERRPDDSIVARMVARRPFVPLLGLALPVVWMSRAWSEPETLRLRFVHLAGATRGMDVTWRIEDTLDGCRVTIEHVFAPRIPGWAAFVDAGFTRPIATRTLATFKAVAEALAPETARETSERAAATNQPV
jgi:ribosome-associated toxin RatA of RatAB toxin-antitoxin module